MPPAFATIVLIGKYKSPDVAEPLLRLAEFLRGRGVRVVVDAVTAAHVAHDGLEVLPLDQAGGIADLAIVIGGDGTMLNIARTLVPYEVPLVGVNQGRLGFLTDISVDIMLDTIGAVLDGRFVTEERMLIASKVWREGECIFDVKAFNDCSVAKGADGGLIELEVHINDQFVYFLRADGLIVSTPTGSTAYALSAGGPILHPSLSAFAVVPVCPHTLSNRPIAVGSDSVVEILMHRCADARVHYDSHSHCPLEAGDRIVVRRYPKTIHLLHPIGHSYYHMLREKLHWSEAL